MEGKAGGDDPRDRTEVEAGHPIWQATHSKTRVRVRVALYTLYQAVPYGNRVSTIVCRIFFVLRYTSS